MEGLKQRRVPLGKQAIASSDERKRKTNCMARRKGNRKTKLN
jgi:hypothetical protein